MDKFVINYFKKCPKWPSNRNRDYFVIGIDPALRGRKAAGNVPSTCHLAVLFGLLKVTVFDHNQFVGEMDKIAHTSLRPQTPQSLGWLKTALSLNKLIPITCIKS